MKSVVTPRIKPEEERLNLEGTKEQFFGLVRALSDVPGAYCYLDENKLKIYKCKIVSDEVKGQVGAIVRADKSGLEVQLSNGVISILELQKEGKNRMDYKSFLNGNQGLLGKILK